MTAIKLPSGSWVVREHVDAIVPGMDGNVITVNVLVGDRLIEADRLEAGYSNERYQAMTDETATLVFESEVP